MDVPAGSGGGARSHGPATWSPPGSRRSRVDHRVERGVGHALLDQPLGLALERVYVGGGQSERLAGGLDGRCGCGGSRTTTRGCSAQRFDCPRCSPRGFGLATAAKPLSLNPESYLGCSYPEFLATAVPRTIARG